MGRGEKGGNHGGVVKLFSAEAIGRVNELRSPTTQTSYLQGKERIPLQTSAVLTTALKLLILKKYKWHFE